MRAPSFWYQRSLTPAAILLQPASWLFRLGGFLRRKFAIPYHAAVPVICIGNVVAGGAGKTPTAMALAEKLLGQGHKPVFVTRGYGGNLQGPVRVDLQQHASKDVGDEALLLSAVAPTWVGRDRAAAIRAAEPHATHIIMDDGLQNPHVAPSYSMLVVDGTSGWGNGQVIPAGPLREPIAAALSRVQAVIVVGAVADPHLLSSIPSQVIRAEWQADVPADFPLTSPMLAFAGIGRPQKFFATCHAAGLLVVETLEFADHHPYSDDDLTRLRTRAQQLGARLVTTAKDWVRLPGAWQREVLVLPARLKFADASSLASLLKE